MPKGNAKQFSFQRHVARQMIGQRVQARWHDGHYYPATVHSLNPDNSHNVRWDDGGAVERTTHTKPLHKNKLEAVREHLPKVTAADVRNMVGWTDAERGKTGSGVGAFWHETSERLPAEHQRTTAAHVYRGLSVALHKVPSIMQDKAATAARSVESWTTNRDTAQVYAHPQAYQHKHVGVLVKKPSHKIKQLAHISHRLLEHLNPSDGTNKNQPRLNAQDEVVAKGGYRIHPKDIEHFHVEHSDMPQLAHHLGIAPATPRRGQRLSEGWRLHMANGRPHHWSTSTTTGGRHEQPVQPID